MARTLDEIIDQLEIREQVEAMPFYAGKKGADGRVEFEQAGFPKIPQGVKAIDPKDETLKGNFIYISKSSLPEFKTLVGVPDEVADQNKRAFETVMDEQDLEEMSLPERAVRFLTQPSPKKGSRGLIDWSGKEEMEAFLLKAASELPVFIADEMNVEDGETITVKDTVVLVFRRLHIKKQGKVDFSGNYYTKIVTQTLDE